MPDVNDMDLIREYADRDSEPAFTELVHRHINLVYSVALRYVGNSQDAQDVTQAVFTILAQKTANLRQRPTLTGWLYETTRFTSARLLRTKARQQAREQEAYMQSTLNDSDTDGVWRQLAPLLEEAMTRLGEKERTLLALRFFENKSGAETAALLGIQEWAAHKRAARALEKLRRFFLKRGIDSTTAIIAGAISANSVQAAPIGLAKSISAVAIAKGAVASGSTLTLIKGALKLMAWAKTKTAVVVSAGVLLAAGTTTVTVKEIQAHTADDSWRVPNPDSQVLDRASPQVRIVPSRFRRFGGWVISSNNKALGISASSTTTLYQRSLALSSDCKAMGIGASVSDILEVAYMQTPARTIVSTDLPQERYDFIASRRSGNAEALQKEVKKKLGLVGRRVTREMDALLLQVKNSDAPGLKPSNARNLGAYETNSASSGAGHYSWKNQPLSNLAGFLEVYLELPVIDRTGLTNRFDINLKWDQREPDWILAWPEKHHNPDAIKQALTDQLGLELVPSREPIEMLVVEKAKD
jgi:uncharacterized protein (TIGR03435 family)